MQFLTFQEFINKNVNKYPLYFLHTTEHQTTLAICDFVFNALNVNIEEEDVERLEVEKDLYKEIPSSYFNGCELYAVKGNYSRALTGLYTIDELDDISYAQALSFKPIDMPFVPYPNFTARYSFLYNQDKELLDSLDRSWWEGMKWYYQECQKFFESDKARLYKFAVPLESDTAAWESLIHKWSLVLEPFYRNTAELDAQVNITMSYNCEFNGDIKEFLTRKWHKELFRIQGFIEQAICRIDLKLTESDKKCLH